MAFNGKEFLLNNWIKIVILASFIANVGMGIDQMKRQYVDTSRPDFKEEIRLKPHHRSYISEIVHMCCRSEWQQIFPTTMTDIFEIERNISELGDKQFYGTESCIQLTNCDVCRCEMIKTLVSLVYQDTEDGKTIHKTGQFPADTCCKCIRI